MEETFTPEPQVPAEQPQGIILLQDAQAYLVTAGKWAQFLAIMGFICTGFLVLASLFMGTLMSAMPNFPQASRMGAGVGRLFAFFYLLIAVFYFLVSLYTYQFGARVKEGVVFSSSTTVTEGLGKLKSLFKTAGIVIIVMLVLYVFIIIGVIVFASHISHAVTTPDFN